MVERTMVNVKDEKVLVGFCEQGHLAHKEMSREIAAKLLQQIQDALKRR